MFKHTLSDVSVGATDSYCVDPHSAEIAAQTLSDVPVGATDSYCVDPHSNSDLQTLSDSLVDANISY